MALEGIAGLAGLATSAFGALNAGSGESTAASDAQAGVSAASGAISAAGNAALGDLSTGLTNSNAAELSGTIGSLQSIGINQENANAAIQPQATASYSALQSYFNLLGISTGTSNASNYANQLEGASNSSALGQIGTDNANGVPQPGYNPATLTPGGTGANTQTGAAAGSGTNPSVLQSLQNTPGYQFALQQGLLATANSFGSQGQALGGNAIAGSQSYAEGLASQTYQNAVTNAANAYTSTSPYAAQISANDMAAGQAEGLTYMNYGNVDSAAQLKSADEEAQTNIGMGSALASADLAGAGISATAATAGAQQSTSGLLSLGSSLTSAAGNSTLMAGISSLF